MAPSVLHPDLDSFLILIWVNTSMSNRNKSHFFRFRPSPTPSECFPFRNKAHQDMALTTPMNLICILSQTKEYQLKNTEPHKLA